MRSILDAGVGIDSKASPRRAAIEKAQTELSREYDVLQERRRELEFLEKGGNPLEFKPVQTDSVNGQSISHTNQHLQHILTSAAKGSFSLTASPPGNSIESSERPGNSADNLSLFDVENKVLEDCPTKKYNVAPSEQPSQLNGCKIAKESEDSAIFRPYARRKRSKSNCDGGRSNSTDIIPSHGGHALSVLPHHSLRITNNQKLSYNRDVHNKDFIITAPKDIHDGPRAVADTCPTVSVNFECSPSPCAVTTKNENEITKNGFSNLQGERVIAQNEVQIQISCAALSTGNSNPKSSCTKKSLCLEGINESDLCNNISNRVDSVIFKGQVVALEGINIVEGKVMINEEDITGSVNGVLANVDYKSVVTAEEVTQTTRSSLQNVGNLSSKIDVMETNYCALSKTDEKTDNSSKPDVNISSSARPQCTIGSSISEPPDASSSGKDPADAQGLQTCDDRLKVANKAHEDSILEEARVIEAKRKRISDLSVGTSVLGNRRKSNWDFVLEEMAWLANDFSQERLWKISTASQISNWVASGSRSRFEEQILCREQKKVAFPVAKAVMHFWHSIEKLVNTVNPNITGSARDYGYDASKEDFENSTMETSKDLELKYGVNTAPIRGYGVRFLKYNRIIVPCFQAETPQTPDRMVDLEVLKSSSESQFEEGSLFYKAPSGSLETYRKSIEYWLIQYQKSGCIMMQDMYDAIKDFSQENAYDEDEGETNLYYYPGGFKRSKISHKKRKNSTKYIAGAYESGSDFRYGHNAIEKRPKKKFNTGSKLAKRVRTASRQRLQTNSLYDDQSTFYNGTQLQKRLEVDYVDDFEIPQTFDSGEISTKSQKKKKAKHRNGNSKRRLETHHLESDGSYGQHSAKKPKMKNQYLDYNFNDHFPTTESINSLVSSQIGGWDRGKKTKSSKMPMMHPGSGSRWPSIKDQGSARHMQGPMEEVTILSHFEKIIQIEQRKLHLRSQSDDQKPIAPVHDSHFVALALRCSNKGDYLSPLELIEMSASSPDFTPLGIQGPHSMGLPITNQGSEASSICSSLGTNLSHGSPGTGLASPISSPLGPINASVRHGFPRTSLPIEEQHRLQQYNPTISGRNNQQSSLPVPIPGGNSMGLMCKENRSLPISGTEFQSIASSSSMLNSGSMLSSSQGFRPREGLHISPTGQNPKPQRHMMSPQFQIRGTSQVVPHFNGPNPNFSNQTTPPVPTNPIHSLQHQHQLSAKQASSAMGPVRQPMGPNHPAYAQFKERRLQQQRMMQQQQHNARMQHTQSQPQLPLSSSSMQNNSPSLAGSPVSSQSQGKYDSTIHQGIGRGPQVGAIAIGANNQISKKNLKQAPPHQQFGRQHPQQRQQHSQLNGISGTGLNSVKQSQLVNQAKLHQQKLLTGQSPALARQVQALQQAVPSPVMTSNHQQQQISRQHPTQKQVNQTDQQPMNNSSHIGEMASMPRVCAEPMNETRVASSSSEPVNDSVIQNPATTPANSVGEKLSRSNPIPPSTQGSVQRQLSGDLLPPHVKQQKDALNLTKHQQSLN